MRRYCTLPISADWYDGPDAEDYLSRTVYEPDRSPQRTGLIDAHGNDIYAVDEPERIGFVRFWDAR